MLFFSDTTLEPIRKFLDPFDPNRFVLDGIGIILKAKGNSVADCSPLLCIPSGHSYTAQVVIEIEGNVIGGLVLF